MVIDRREAYKIKNILRNFPFLSRYVHPGILQSAQVERIGTENMWFTTPEAVPLYEQKLFLLNERGDLISRVGQEYSALAQLFGKRGFKKTETVLETLERIGNKAASVIYVLYIDTEGKLILYKMPPGVPTAKHWRDEILLPTAYLYA